MVIIVWELAGSLILFQGNPKSACSRLLGSQTFWNGPCYTFWLSGATIQEIPSRRLQKLLHRIRRDQTLVCVVGCCISFTFLVLHLHIFHPTWGSVCRKALLVSTKEALLLNMGATRSLLHWDTPCSTCHMGFITGLDNFTMLSHDTRIVLSFTDGSTTFLASWIVAAVLFSTEDIGKNC